MTRSTAKTTYNSPKDKLIDFIVKGIETKDVLPWDSGLLNGAILPRNYISKRNYRGTNFLLLNYFGKENGSQEWVTYLQAKENGGTVRKGEKGLPIIYFTYWDKKRKCKADVISEKENIVPISKYSTVFEISQCDGLESRREPLHEINHPSMSDVDDLIKTFADKTSLTLELDKVSGNGFYSPLEHLVSVAALKYYRTKEDYYSTLFHELVHSTGTAMGRKVGGSFGSETYSEEEIVAETGAMLMCMEFGIAKTARENSLAYVKGWSKSLKANPSWLIKGMNEAEKAVHYFFETVGYTPQFI